MLYIFVFTQFQTQSRCTSLLELLYRFVETRQK